MGACILGLDAVALHRFVGRLQDGQEVFWGAGLTVLEALVALAAAAVITRILFGYVARLAAWIDSGFESPGPPVTGAEGMRSLRGVAWTALDPRGKVRVRGELWNAEASEPVAAGGEVEVVAVEGLTLRVAPPQQKSNEHDDG